MSSPSTAAPLAKRYYPALDGVRAWCVLLVMYDHIKAPGHTVHWINGHLGVDVFFILSGLLITTGLREEQQATGRNDLGAFYWRRLLRIVPLYLVTLLLYVVVCKLPGQSLHWVQLWGGMPYFLTFLNEFAREPGNGTVFMHTWSLGIEEKFYFVWPFLFFAFARTSRMRAGILALLLGGAAMAPFAGQRQLATSYFGLLIGCLLAVILSSNYAPSVITLVQKLPASLVLALGVLAFALIDVSKSLMFLFSSLIAIFLLHLMVKPSWLSRLHSLPPLVWLGRRSYAMYLVHVLCLNALESRLPATNGWRVLLLLGLAYGMAAVAAQILFVLVERPSQKLGRRLLRDRAQKLGAQNTASPPR